MDLCLCYHIKKFLLIQCCCSVTNLCLTLWCHGLQHASLHCPSLSHRVCSNSCSLTRWCHLTISSCHLIHLSSIFPSIKIFSSNLALHIRYSKYWSFSFSISPSNEHSGLISFRINLFDHLAVLRILKSLLQHHNSKASVLQHSAFLMVQISHPYMTTGKTIALII